MKKSYTILNKEDFRRFSDQGSQSSLSFSSQLVLRDRIIGLDGLKKKLLISESKDRGTSYSIIELDKVKSVSVKKSYTGIKAGELDKRTFEEFTRSIQLFFEYYDGTEEIIPIYETELDEPSNLPRLEKMVRKWQVILTKMIRTNKDTQPVIA